MTEAEALESAAAVASVSHHGFQASAWRQRPFRAPHHTASGVALVGGGSHRRPGEISLALYMPLAVLAATWVGRMEIQNHEVACLAGTLNHHLIETYGSLPGERLFDTMNAL